METSTVNLKMLVNGTTANFSHAIGGVLYYEIVVEDKTYQFPVDMNDKDDVGYATFPASIKAITLMRYIRKAINKKELVIM